MQTRELGQVMESAAGKWYIINTLTQYEKRVSEAVQRQIDLSDPAIPVFEVQYPLEKTMEIRNGVRHLVERKYFPGYVFVRMNLYEEEGRVNEKVWHFINGINGVSKIGGAMSDEEVAQWVTVPGAEEVIRQQTLRPQYNAGDQVEIGDGPFTGFKGTVKEVDPERRLVKVEIMVFARPTPMELEEWQVEKITD